MSRTRHTDQEKGRIIQCDGYIVYHAWAKKKAWIKLMGCHSHVRRKFFEAMDQSPRLVAWILRQLAHLYHIEERLRDAKAGPAMREAVRAAESSMIHRRIKKVFDNLALRRSILPKSKLGKAISCAINQWPNLETYLGDGRVEICNNLVENAILPTKLGAKNWLFIGNEMSGQKCAILYTIVENCRRLGINPKEYLTDVLTRLPAMLAKDAITLTPANWLKAAAASRSGRWPDFISVIDLHTMTPMNPPWQNPPHGASDYAYGVEAIDQAAGVESEGGFSFPLILMVLPGCFLTPVSGSISTPVVSHPWEPITQAVLTGMGPLWNRWVKERQRGGFTLWQGGKMFRCENQTQRMAQLHRSCGLIHTENFHIGNQGQALSGGQGVWVFGEM